MISSGSCSGSNSGGRGGPIMRPSSSSRWEPVAASSSFGWRDREPSLGLPGVAGQDLDEEGAEELGVVRRVAECAAAGEKREDLVFFPNETGKNARIASSSSIGSDIRCPSLEELSGDVRREALICRRRQAA